MRKSLLIILTLGAFALVANDAGAARISVSLTRGQVANVCNGKSFCEVSCGLDKQYTCTFGCGSKGCSGECQTCPARTTGVRAIRTIVNTAGASFR
jgi:hypothetical protein